MPRWFEAFLKLVGISPVWFRWRMRFIAQRWQERMERLKQGGEKKRRYKWCRHCGQLALAEHKVCECGKRLPTYIGSWIGRKFALNAPDFRWVTTVFLGIIAVLFCLQLARHGMRCLLNPPRETLLVFGAFTTWHLQQGEIWRLFSMALVHIGIIHVGFNLMAISQMLPRFEEDVGPAATLTIITLTQIGAAIGHLIWYEPYVVTGGASGVAFGLIGFGLAYFHILGRKPERRFFFQWMCYGAVFGLMIRANNAAHFGGFLAGLPLGWLLALPRGRAVPKKVWTGLAAVSLLIWVATCVCLAQSILNAPPLPE